MELLHTNHTALQNLISEIIGLERIGDYEQAFELLREFWSDITEPPDVDGLPPVIAGEILLRCGSIVGFLGNLKQIPNAQEHSKNILTKARSTFIKLYKPEKIAECENYLALTYYRKGEYNEAKVWVEEALSHKLNNQDEIRLHSRIISTLVLLAESKFDEVISYLKSVRSYFDETDYLLRGSYCTHLSLAYKNIGELDKSLRHLNFARFCFQKAKHHLYLASVENNLAQLYKLQREFPKALESADNAIQLFTEMNDARRIAFSIDTKAQIFIAQEDFKNAVNLADEAIKILKRGENTGMLSEVYLTKATAFLHLENIGETVLSIFEAVRLAKLNGESQAKRIVESFELAWLSKFPPKIKKLYSELEKTLTSENDIELDLPPEISPNQEFFGVWIKNNNFERFGLRKGYLAIVVGTKIKRGDLVAVSDKDTDLVSIGFFEREFGLIGLENPTSEPDLFNENQIQIMGKVVGYCEPEINAQGRYMVKPISLKNKFNNETDNLS
ncbi:MAG: tetratricopeptide repeat protein [Pyrinomonadaceae bacterium]